MLDDAQILKQRDRLGALDVAAKLHAQISREIPVINEDHDGRELRHVVVAGMGGSALAADAAKVLLRDTLPIPLEVVKDYALPAYAAKHTLVIASSHSGNTEETVSCLRQAIKRGCQIAVIATGGEVVRIARSRLRTFRTIRSRVWVCCIIYADYSRYCTILIYYQARGSSNLTMPSRGSRAKVLSGAKAFRPNAITPSS